MKKMIYYTHPYASYVSELLYTDTYKGYNFFIISRGTHPCCYVEIPKCHKLFGEPYQKIDCIDCHGGITYSEPKLEYDGGGIGDSNTWFIGWDYAHTGDFVGFDPVNGWRKYTTQELVEDCIDVIEQLIKVAETTPKEIRVIAIDFDGCICTNNYPLAGEPDWDIINEAKEAKKNGAKLILWTCRCDYDLDMAIKACKDWGLTFDAVNDNVEEWQRAWGNNTRKVGATEYWDDKSVLKVAKKKEKTTIFNLEDGYDKYTYVVARNEDGCWWYCTSTNDLYSAQETSKNVIDGKIFLSSDVSKFRIETR